MAQFKHIHILLNLLALFCISLTYYSSSIKRNVPAISKVRRKLTVSQPIYHPFKSWDRTKVPFPCISPDGPSYQGFFYIKVPKTSSTTLAKITGRIAGREARRINLGYDTCKVYDPMVHHSAFDLQCKYRDKFRSFLWSVVRHPSDRAVSHYGMKMKRGELENSEEKFITFLDNNEFLPNVQLQYLSPDDPNTINKDNYEDVVKSIIDEFNFIGVYERLHESLVVLSMLIGVGLNDVMFDFVPSSNGRCGSLKKASWLTPEMEKYLESDTWKEKEKGDFMLYEAVNKSLDLTIDMLGRERVKQNLEHYNHIVEIGTDISIQEREMGGCGLIDLHPKVKPYDNIEDLSWFGKLLPHDQEYIKKYA